MFDGDGRKEPARLLRSGPVIHMTQAMRAHLDLHGGPAGGPLLPIR